MAKCEIRNQIRRLRFEKAEMTQQQLAEKTGVTRQTIIAIEQAKYTPSLALGLRIAQAFGKSVEEVFEFRDSAAMDSSESEEDEGP